ncbi:hypothetical protein SAMN05216439_1340 [Methanobrevibacter gottschalkii]|uniref:DUF2124 domain-containing protein n=1 Tax=Methanobrevibacter gottschalkii TaxID=190974 RepID=A0A1H7J6H4_9EURY|nr:DUF2124 family protein [Methanobrevibacter gottschalkii]MCQ2970944.1 DUF2124 domain-containing protein [archaeon]SEK69782.1 hypothetical protein SAMN05216439_1340 [Methanobrevibacter gottschalkii]
MEDVYDWKGINGQIMTFKKEVGDAKKITYIGSPGVCTPFAELLAYSVRDKENHFIPLVNVDDCHKFESKYYGMVLNDEVSDPHDSDVVVLLGGLSMPKYNLGTGELNDLIKDILKDDGQIIGVCFMNMFTKVNWLDKFDFDCVIDGNLVGVVKK